MDLFPEPFLGTSLREMNRKVAVCCLSVCSGIFVFIFRTIMQTLIHLYRFDLANHFHPKPAFLFEIMS